MKEYLVKPGGKVKLAAWDANDTGDFRGNKQQAKLDSGIAFVILRDRRKRRISYGGEGDPSLWLQRRLWDLREGRMLRLVAPPKAQDDISLVFPRLCAGLGVCSICLAALEKSMMKHPFIS
jgi:hypothetical protein